MNIQYSFFIIAIISVIIILWYQYPNIKDKEDEDNIIYIYDKIKLPFIIVCLILLFYLLCKNNSNEINHEVYHSIPNF